MWTLPAFKHLLNSINQFSARLADRDVYTTNAIGVARSVLAMGTLITILSTPYGCLFSGSLDINDRGQVISSINFFHMIRHPLWAKLGAALLLVSVISGYLPRITGILHYWICNSLFTASSIVDGGDQITMLLTLFLLPVTLLDPRINHWHTGKSFDHPYTNIFVSLVLQLIAIQMAVIYFHAVVAKLNVPEWVNGTAVYYFLNHNHYGAPPMIRNVLNVLFSSPLVMLLFNWGALISEILLFGALFMSRANRKRMLIIGLLFHFTIIVFHGLMSFFFAMAGGLILYLYPADENFPLPGRLPQKRQEL